MGCRFHSAATQDGSALVSVLDDFHGVAALIGVEPVGSPVVEDQQFSPGQRAEQTGVAALSLHELFVAAALDDATVFDDQDLVGHAHRRKTV